MTYGQDYGRQDQYPHQPYGQQYPPQPPPWEEQPPPWEELQGQWPQQPYPSQAPAVLDSYRVPVAAGPVAPHQPRPVYGLTAAQKFWYILSNIAFGAGYFAKIPAKKAMADFGMAELTGAEAFWYILMCLPFGAGYFAKLSVAKALSELPQFCR